MASVPGSPNVNAERAAAVLAAHPDAEIAVFPELFLGGYDLSRLADSARPADSAELRTVAEAAAALSTAVVVGFAERNADGTFSNSVACIDRDRALENRLPHLYVNGVGTIGGLRLVGLSRSVGPAGDVLAEAGAEEELLVAPVARPGADDERVDYLRHLPDPLDIIGGDV